MAGARWELREPRWPLWREELSPADDFFLACVARFPTADGFKAKRFPEEIGIQIRTAVGLKCGFSRLSGRVRKVSDKRKPGSSALLVKLDGGLGNRRARRLGGKSITADEITFCLSALPADKATSMINVFRECGAR